MNDQTYITGLEAARDELQAEIDRLRDALYTAENDFGLIAKHSSDHIQHWAKQAQRDIQRVLEHTSTALETE